MRMMVFFDLPMVTKKELREYRKFRKLLITSGFYMIQESVYVKMAIDRQVIDSTANKINGFLPPKGNIMMLVITEKQFASMRLLLGESKTDVLTSDDRIVVL